MIGVAVLKKEVHVNSSLRRLTYTRRNRFRLVGSRFQLSLISHLFRIILKAFPPGIVPSLPTTHILTCSNIPALSHVRRRSEQSNVTFLKPFRVCEIRGLHKIFLRQSAESGRSSLASSAGSAKAMRVSGSSRRRAESGCSSSRW